MSLHTSKSPGAVAAPTAGLHLDAALLERLEARGIGMATVTLHVGAGTFQPVRHDDLSLHRMHAEWYRIGDEALAAVAAARQQGGRLVAVGTTVLRALESGHAAERCAPAPRRPSCSSHRASRSRSWTCWSPTSTCRAARC